MYSPAVALAWEFWGRNRWIFGAFAAFVAASVVIATVAPGTAPHTIVGGGSICFLIGLAQLITVFAHGSEVRLETADSGFPARYFLLPVRTSILVGWPMLQGVLAAVVAWIVWDRLVLRAYGIETPFWWTAMLAAGVATTQALLWVPFALPWVRLPVTLAVLTALVQASALLALAGERFTEPETENTILSVFALLLIPLAFLLARAGVSRARCGASPDWLRLFSTERRTGEHTREWQPFSSPMRAQVWYEWRLRGFGFVLLVLFTVVVWMAGGLVLQQDVSHAEFGVSVLFVPLLIACFCGSGTGASGDSFRSLVALPVFTATRPMSNSALVVAKLWAAGLTATVTWVMVVAVTLAWLIATGGIRELLPVWEHAVSRFGVARAGLLCILLAVGPVVIIWRLLVENLWIGLTGRLWMVWTTGIVAFAIMVLVMNEWAGGMIDPGRTARILDALPWIAGVAVALKLLVAVFALRALCQRGELTTGTLVKLVSAWSGLAVVLFGLLVWLIPAGQVPVYGLALGVVLTVPLARLAVAPLALAWNRHR